MFYSAVRENIFSPKKHCIVFQIKLVSSDAQAIPERHPGRRDGVGQDHPGNLILGSPQGDGRRGPTSHHRSVVHHG